jgi:Zn2+/Cd2+-exporting ATPase
MAESIITGSGGNVPEHGSRCTDVLSDTLAGYAGIERADLDMESGKLNIEYDPRIISREQALKLVQRSGQQATSRVMQCRAKGTEACAACALEMRENLVQHYSHLANMPAPVTQFQPGSQTGAIEVQLPHSTVIGHDTVAVEADFSQKREAPAARGFQRDKAEIFLTIMTVLFGVAAFASSQVGANPLVTLVLWVGAYAAGGYYGLLDGIQTLREKKLDVNLLMVMAALGAAAIGQPVEGAILLFLFSLSNTLQSFAMDRSRKAIEKLLDLRPPTATVRRGSRVMTLPVEKLVINDIVLVRPGERFPVDGEIISGSSEVNQAPITGESDPVFKSPSDPVFAGTVNGNGGLEVRMTRSVKDSTLANIVKMVEEAQGKKAQTQRMLDDFEQGYALIVLGGAALLILIPYFLLGHEFFPTFYRSMTWLVVASPCALVISTPASILSAIANGARNGILFKGGVHLEKAATLKVIAFDKTGTLTRGKPRVLTIRPFSELSETSFLRMVAAVEARSEHPLAAAIVAAAQERKIDLPTASSFRAVPGQGIEGRVDDEGGESKVVWVGGRRLFFERGVAIPAEIIAQVEAVEAQGQTVMLGYSEGTWLGLLGSADVLRDNAKQVIESLKRNGIERVVMLTGDNERVAARMAQQAGVDEFHANLLPQDKVTMLQALREKYGPVAMVGDGVNDAPALATADIGIAMGAAGTDVAMETADMVLMSDDLKKLPHAIGLSRRARKIVWQNLTFAMAVILLLVMTTFGANLALPLGVIGHEGSTVLVVLNGLRLLGFRS